MNNFYKALVLLCVLFGELQPAFSSDQVHIFTENYPPYNMFAADDKTIIGKSTAIVRQIFKDAKVDYTLTLAPWARSLKSAEIDQYSAVFSTARTPDREQKFHWIGPLIINKWVFMGRKKDGIILDSMADIKPFLLGTYRSDISFKFLSDKGFKVQVTSLDAQNPLKLSRGRIDLWSTGILLGPYLAKLEKVAGLEVIKKSNGQPFVFIEVGMYLALNKNMPVEIVTPLTRAFENMSLGKLAD